MGRNFIQPSYDKNFIESISCSYTPKLKKSIWGLPGKSNNDLPTGYKYCVSSTSLGESDLIDLIKEELNAKPGIYILSAIPDKITSTTKPLRRVFCRPKTFC